jgi:hypothetical protein
VKTKCEALYRGRGYHVLRTRVKAAHATCVAYIIDSKRDTRVCEDSQL